MVRETALRRMQDAVYRKETSVTTEYGRHGIQYGEDEEGNEYGLVGLNLPEGFYAEIDGETYGALQGIRIYR
jgi:hypothetical protein